MLGKVSAMTLRQNLGHILNEISYTHNPVMVVRAGKPMAVIVDVETFNRKIKPQSFKQKKQSLNKFLNKIQVDLTNFKFNRNEANER